MARTPGWQGRWTNREVPAAAPCPILSMSRQVHFPELDDDPQSRQSALPSSKALLPECKGLGHYGWDDDKGFRLSHGDSFRIVPETLWAARPISR